MKRNICFLLLVFCLSMRLCYSQGEKAIVFYNWEDYTDKSLLEEFEKEFGIKVILKEFKTQDMLISEFQSEPDKYDVILADDRSVNLLQQYRLVTKLDLTKIPNSKFIKTQFKTLLSGTKKEFAIVGPLYGLSALVINTNFVPADADSWAILWDKKYKGKIALFDDSRDGMGAVLKYSNFSLNTVNLKELDIAEENAKLLRENDIQFGDTFENIEKVMKGELWIAQAYSGDIIYKTKGRNDIKCVLPKEGFNLWVDTLAISIDSSHKDEAHKFINFLLEAKNAARIANKFSYPTVIEADNLLNEENRNNLEKYFTKDNIQKGEFFKDLRGDVETKYDKIFNLLKLKK